MLSNRCPICSGITKTHREIDAFKFRIDCKRCGEFEMSRETFEDLPAEIHRFDKELWAAKISYALRRMQGSNRVPTVTLGMLRQIYNEQELPTPPSKGDNLIIFVGDNMLHQPGEYFELETEKIIGLAARIGGRSMDDVWYVVRELKNQGLIEDNSSGSYPRLRSMQQPVDYVSSPVTVLAVHGVGLKQANPIPSEVDFLATNIHMLGS